VDVLWRQPRSQISDICGQHSDGRPLIGGVVGLADNVVSVTATPPPLTCEHGNRGPLTIIHAAISEPTYDGVHDVPRGQRHCRDVRSRACQSGVRPLAGHSPRTEPQRGAGPHTDDQASPAAE
jgi:hypothetical protein